MSLHTQEELDEFGDAKTINGGETLNVVIKSYEPFTFGANKDKRMPKYLCVDSDSGEDIEMVGFKFHEEAKKLNDQIEIGVTVLAVEGLENGTQYPDYEIKVVSGEKKEETPFD